MESQPESTDSMIDHLSDGQKQITLIRTAHVSRQSAQLVTDIIAEQKPDTVCVELCDTRLASIRDKDRWSNMNIVKVIREKKALLLFMNLLMASFQKKMADKFGIHPGQEMMNAIESAEAIDSAIIPADREIQITLTRLWRGMSLWEKLKLMVSFIFSFTASEDIEEDDIENMKQQDMLQSLLADVKKIHPAIEQILLDERDRFLTEKIRTAPGEKIVAVVGAAHAPGIKKYFETQHPVDLDELNQVPPPGKLGGILKWILPLIVIAVFVFGFAMEGSSAGKEMVWIWIAANGLFAGIGAILALAHPFTIIASVLAAPLTSLNPMVAAGWVSGLVEAFSRKPKVKDLEAIPQDITSVKGFWRNNVTRILLVVIFTNLGSTIGTFVALPLMVKLFGG